MSAADSDKYLDLERKTPEEKYENLYPGCSFIASLAMLAKARSINRTAYEMQSGSRRRSISKTIPPFLRTSSVSKTKALRYPSDVEGVGIRGKENIWVEVVVPCQLAMFMCT